ncbi:MAG: GNAT family N-acetyltransferase [Rudanella sp.]|nr:GNAT family N-acetyltransferase [Rudanella sp.]
MSRSAINPEAWNRCLDSSPNRIIYTYTWYLDAVTNLPDWRWEGLILRDKSGDYRAVMPVPLRHKFGVWVVHQPLFCQFLGVFGAKITPDLVEAFARTLLKKYRYGSIFHVKGSPAFAEMERQTFNSQQAHTHLLDLSNSYQTIYGNYSSDTRRHLRQAQAAQWLVQESTDPVPLLALFRKHHAHQIPGGVGDWAYGLFENLFGELQKRGLATLQYATRAGRIEAGAIFIESDNRLIYLFNAASELGRKHHARTLLIDGIIQQQAGRDGIIFDFESPEKESVAQFYQGFGATESPFCAVRWNRLPWLMRVGKSLTCQHALTKLRGHFQAVEPLNIHL